MDKYCCFYVDHTFFEAEKIGELYLNHLKSFSNQTQNTCVLLSTCQRIEIYTQGNANFLAYLDLPFKKISGLQPVTNRLTAIVAGIYSQILGEKQIVEQVRIIEGYLDNANPFKKIFAQALEQGLAFRKKHKFKSELGYGDVAIQLMNIKHPIKDNKKELVIIGSGMLAKSMLDTNHLFDFYDKIYFVTRAYKSLKKILKHLSNVNVCNIGNLENKFSNQYHCVVATTDLTIDYQERLSSIFNASNCLAVFDYSAVPLFAFNNQVDTYLITYKADYLNFVNLINNRLVEVSEKIKNEIFNPRAYSND